MYIPDIHTLYAHAITVKQAGGLRVIWSLHHGRPAVIPTVIAPAASATAPRYYPRRRFCHPSPHATEVRWLRIRCVHTQRKDQPDFMATQNPGKSHLSCDLLRNDATFAIEYDSDSFHTYDFKTSRHLERAKRCAQKLGPTPICFWQAALKARACSTAVHALTHTDLGDCGFKACRTGGLGDLSTQNWGIFGHWVGLQKCQGRISKALTRHFAKPHYRFEPTLHKKSPRTAHAKRQIPQIDAF